MGEIHRVVSVSFRQGLAFVRGNLHRPYGFGRNGTVFGVAPPPNVEALPRRRSPKSGTVALRNLVPLYLAGTTSFFVQHLAEPPRADRSGAQCSQALVESSVRGHRDYPGRFGGFPNQFEHSMIRIGAAAREVDRDSVEVASVPDFPERTPVENYSHLLAPRPIQIGEFPQQSPLGAGFVAVPADPLPYHVVAVDQIHTAIVSEQR